MLTIQQLQTVQCYGSETMIRLFSNTYWYEHGNASMRSDFRGLINTSFYKSLALSIYRKCEKRREACH
jgi:hypothetical protein